MITGRFNLAPVIRGHWRGLSTGPPDNLKADWFSRLALLLIPIAVIAVGIWRGWELKAAAPLLSGVALLAGALVSAFTHLSTLRVNVTEWSKKDEERWANERDMIDETAAHLLMAALACVLEAMLIVIGLNVRSGDDEVVQGPLAGVCLGVASYIVLLFVLCLPRLYGAYVELNTVGSLSGFDKGKRRRS